LVAGVQYQLAWQVAARAFLPFAMPTWALAVLLFLCLQGAPAVWVAAALLLIASETPNRHRAPQAIPVESQGEEARTGQ